MSGSLTFYNKSAASLGMRIGGVDIYKTTGNNVQTVRIPGRIGEVVPVSVETLINNEIREYKAALYMRASSVADVEAKFAEIRHWLLDHEGYQTLTDSYEPSFYRRAYFSGDFVPMRKGAGQNFEIPLRFSCDPRRYIANVADTVMNSGAAGSMTAAITPPQPTGLGQYITVPAKPMIKIEGGYANDPFTLTITDSQYAEDYGHISVAEDVGTFYFDVETLNATSGPGYGSDLNAWITDVSGDLSIGVLGGFVKRTNVDAKITITPRWWVR